MSWEAGSTRGEQRGMSVVLARIKQWDAQAGTRKSATTAVTNRSQRADGEHWGEGFRVRADQTAREPPLAPSATANVEAGVSRCARFRSTRRARGSRRSTPLSRHRTAATLPTMACARVAQG